MTDHEVTVTVTTQQIKLYERAMEIGLPSIIVSMYGDRIQKLIDDEREACAKLCDELQDYPTVEARHCAEEIRARGQE